MPPPLPAATEAQLTRLATGLTGAVVICGFPASGKSTAARFLHSRTGAPILDKDRFAPLLEETLMARLTGDPHDRDSATYRALLSPGIYDGLIRTALTVAASAPVLVDAPFLSVIRAAHAAGRSLAEHFRAVSGTPDSVPVRTLWLDAPPERIRERMIARGAERDAPKLADWAAYHDGVLAAGNREQAHAVCDLVLET
ncbi:ATP-binding protein [Nocardia sp. NPDC050697]|uniref:AAA family ATPase n=1 Tax=Nocardia sp. NPDC050697 TaxID=3155158 RepID=UPI0033F3D082